MIGLLGIAWAACALGTEGWSLWWIAPLAASGVGLYFAHSARAVDNSLARLSGSLRGDGIAALRSWTPYRLDSVSAALDSPLRTSSQSTLIAAYDDDLIEPLDDEQRTYA
jgi:hypothetical protein